MLYNIETYITEQELVLGPSDEWDIEQRVEALASILKDVLHDAKGQLEAANTRIALLEQRVGHLSKLVLPGLRKERVAPEPKPCGIHAWGLGDVLALIREAGTAGVPAEVLRTRYRAIRTAISDGNHLPSELADAGVYVRKQGKGHWYYIPDFL